MNNWCKSKKTHKLNNSKINGVLDALFEILGRFNVWKMIEIKRIDVWKIKLSEWCFGNQGTVIKGKGNNFC